MLPNLTGYEDENIEDTISSGGTDFRQPKATYLRRNDVGQSSHFDGFRGTESFGSGREANLDRLEPWNLSISRGFGEWNAGNETDLGGLE